MDWTRKVNPVTGNGDRPREEMPNVIVRKTSSFPWPASPSATVATTWWTSNSKTCPSAPSTPLNHCNMPLLHVNQIMNRI